MQKKPSNLESLRLMKWDNLTLKFSQLFVIFDIFDDISIK